MEMLMEMKNKSIVPYKKEFIICEVYESDPFYSEQNMEWIKKGIEQLDNGLGTEHDLIEV